MKTSRKQIENTRKWVSENKDRVRVAGRKYYQEHSDLMKRLAIQDYAKHRAARLKTSLESRQKLKKEVLQRYSPELKCKKCGFDDIDCLEIDHINNDGSEHRKQNNIVGPRILRWLKKNDYPKGFQILCRNCNWKKHLTNIRKQHADKSK